MVATAPAPPAPAAPAGRPRASALRERRRRGLVAAVFLLPAFVLFVLFFLGPAGLGLAYSFTDYRGYGTPEFVGLENYLKLFSDSDFYSSLWRTALYTVVSVPFGYLLTLLISALLVSRETKGAALAQVIFFFPWLISPIVTGVIWRWMFGENFGLANFVIESFGGKAVPWQSNADLSLLVVVFATAWAGAAFNMLLFVAAIRNVPQSYYEAASLDGAGTWHQFRYITLPSIAPTSFIVILLSSLGAFKEFATIQALNGGGPGTDNNLLVQYIYTNGFQNAHIGYASAASMVLMLILMAIALIQLAVNRRTEARR